MKDGEKKTYHCQECNKKVLKLKTLMILTRR